MRSRLHSYDADCLFLPALNLYCKIVPKLYEDNYWQRDAQKKWDLPIATPLPALIDLHQQLATLRIPLYVVIAPETSTLYADYLTGIAAEGHWRANPETAQFAQALEKAGIPCLDLTPLFLRHRFYTYLGQRHTLYLPNDHHWSPYAARLAAQTTADWIRHREKTAPHRATAPPFTEKISVKTWKGNMRRFFPSEPDRVPAASIPFYSLNALTPKAATWRRPSPRAPAWDLLGNSFANIFRAQKSSFHHHLIAALEQPIRLTYSKGGGHTQCRLKWVRTRDISQSRGIIYLLTEKDLIAPRKWLRVSLEQPSKAASP